MDAKTLGEFIESELNKRQMSAREFADFVGVSNAVINKFRNHGINDMFANKPIGEPSVSFLAKLARATSTDICALMALIVPEATFIDPGARLIAQHIARLPPEQREVVDTFLEGVAIKMLKQRKQVE